MIYACKADTIVKVFCIKECDVLRLLLWCREFKNVTQQQTVPVQALLSSKVRKINVLRYTSIA